MRSIAASPACQRAERQAIGRFGWRICPRHVQPRIIVRCVSFKLHTVSSHPVRRASAVPVAHVENPRRSGSHGSDLSTVYECITNSVRSPDAYGWCLLINCESYCASRPSPDVSVHTRCRYARHARRSEPRKSSRPNERVASVASRGGLRRGRGLAVLVAGLARAEGLRLVKEEVACLGAACCLDGGAKVGLPRRRRGGGERPLPCVCEPSRGRVRT